ncbi:DUF5777 family beta-barrel protein [Fulvivirgaceae bacterium BMA12]|uniref:DUF5777 family beta-barrel protein n=1 Tax=Agaribacillus aureus TaxID=3051825 RepID=A0ABT8L562_9BACT|nr:DUF5777 family beta-barrel protein [Fulvivirgaceae bacterium BMA12]
MKNFIISSWIGLCISFPALSQSSSDLGFDDEEDEKTLITSAFNSSYIINTQSTNTLSSGRLNLLISHRFGNLNQGAFNLFGLDFGAMRIGLEYGINNKLTAGLGRSSVGKNYDAFIKYRMLTQSTGGASQTPVSIVGFTSIAFSSVDVRNSNSLDENSRFIDHLVYSYQVLVSRQFSKKFSLQLTPTLIHRNTVTSSQEDNNIVSLGIGGRLKVSKRIHLTADYHYVFNKSEVTKLYDPLAIGMDVVVGGHIFQVHLNNALGMIEKEFITATNGDFFDGDIRIGFTILRSFSIKPEVKGGKMH